MRAIAKIAGFSALALGSSLSSAANADTREEGEAELAELLEGRVAGEPVRCIPHDRTDRMRIIDKTAIVFGSGKTIYVQKTRDPEGIDDRDVLVIRRYGGLNLCRLDNITTVDRYNGIFSGVYFFEDFIPYTRVEDAD